MSLVRESYTIYKQALPILLLSLLGSFFAGVILSGGGMRTAMRSIKGLLLVIPAFLATRGNVYGALGSRISSALHQGLIDPRFEYDRRLASAVIAATINALSVSMFIAIAGWAELRLLNRPAGSLGILFSVLVLAGLVSAVVLSIALIALLFVGFRRGIDPDLLNGPLITSLGDFLGMLILYSSVLLVGGLR